MLSQHLDWAQFQTSLRSFHADFDISDESNRSLFYNVPGGREGVRVTSEGQWQNAIAVLANKDKQTGKKGLIEMIIGT